MNVNKVQIANLTKGVLTHTEATYVPMFLAVREDSNSVMTKQGA